MKNVTLSFSRRVNDVLVAHDLYITTLTEKLGPQAHAEEIAQVVRMKFATALVAKDIRDIHAYLKSMVRHEWSSFFRSRKLVSSLIFVEGELQHGYWLNGQRVSEGFGDPQIALDEAASFYQRLGQLVRTIIRLPPTQKRVAICVLRDRVDYPLLFAEGFKHYGVDISKYQWPTNPKEKQTLLASYFPVQHKLAQMMNIDLKAFKNRSCKSF